MRRRRKALDLTQDELAAARTKLLTVEYLAALLEVHFNLLTTGSRVALSRCALAVLVGACTFERGTRVVKCVIRSGISARVQNRRNTTVSWPTCMHNLAKEHLRRHGGKDLR